MSADEVARLIAELRAGSKTTEEVAELFRQLTWPRTQSAEPRDDAELAEQADPAPEVPGSFDDVLAAYDRGEITRDQYRTLVEAAAESVRARVQSGEVKPGG